MTRETLKSSPVEKTLRFHPVRFHENRVSEDGFGLGEDADEDAWEFSLTANKHGRVFGFFVENVFYIVWLDPDHKLYPRKRR